MKIGRADENDLVLPDAGVSKVHTRIFQAGGRYLVEDLASSNGTLLNGEAVRAPRPLATGDALGIGAALVSFIDLGPDDDGKKLRPVGLQVEQRRRTGEFPAAGSAAATGDEAAGPFAPLVAEPHAVDDEEIITASGEAIDPRRRAAMSEDPTAPRGQALEVSAERTGPDLEGPTRPRVSAPRPPESSHAGAPRATEEPTHPKGSAPLGRGGPRPSAVAPLIPLPSGLPKPLQEQKTEVAPPPAEDKETGLVPSSALKRASEVAQQMTEVRVPSVLAKAEDVATRADAPLVDSDEVTNPPQTSEVEVQLLASERARIRRRAQKTLAGQLGLWWKELEPRSRVIVAGVVTVVALVVGWMIGRLAWPAPAVELPPEPHELGLSPVHASFGVGDGVDYLAVDEKQFTFLVNAPTDTAVIVRFAARDISRDEVSITVNGTLVGSVPADIGVPDRLDEVLIQPGVIHRGEDNLLVFDQVHNPPARETWQVSELSVELLPVLAIDKASALRTAKQQLQQATLLYGQRDVSADNVYRAWKEYRHAWQTLLSVPESERGGLFEQARRKADELGVQLDRECGAMLLEAKKQMELRNPEKAKEILEAVPLAFPGRDHRCQALADEALTRYQL